jgi:hypothetical protein
VLLLTSTFHSNSTSKNQTVGSLFKGFRGFHFTPMDERNILAVKEMIQVPGTSQAENDKKFLVHPPCSRQHSAESSLISQFVLILMFFFRFAEVRRGKQDGRRPHSSRYLHVSRRPPAIQRHTGHCTGL